MKSFYIFYLTFSTLIFSCDCHYSIEGIVVDAQTQKPIDKVEISSSEMSRITFSEPSGDFNYSKTTGFTCDEKKIIFKKDGYIEKEVSIKNSTTTKIELEPIEKP